MKKTFGKAHLERGRELGGRGFFEWRRRKKTKPGGSRSHKVRIQGPLEFRKGSIEEQHVPADKVTGPQHQSVELEPVPGGHQSMGARRSEQTVKIREDGSSAGRGLERV